MDGAGNATERRANVDVDWNSFDSEAYFRHNYGRLLPEDAKIIEIVAEHFHDRAPRRPRAKAIDVGSGPNLYPALTMLPFADEVTLYERALTNRQWLAQQLVDPAESWSRFWAEIRHRRPEYERIADPFDQLNSRAKVEEGDLFGLGRGDYDMGTMFFVAESITTSVEEFEQAIRRFVGSLTPGAPFATAFMRDSSGYTVGEQKFPACPIREGDVARALADVTQATVQRVESHNVREGGYNDMIVATGRA